MDAAERYFSIAETDKAVAVISSRDLLEAANQQLDGHSFSLHSV
jgi:hypothetical protein